MASLDIQKAPRKFHANQKIQKLKFVVFGRFGRELLSVCVFCVFTRVLISTILEVTAMPFKKLSCCIFMSCDCEFVVEYENDNHCSDFSFAIGYSEK